MTAHSTDQSQRRAARVVGFSYLLAMIAGVFADMYARGKLIVANDAAQTAQNIIAHETLWRLGIASNVLCLLTDVALIAALYVVLRPVNPHLALFAAFVRVIETAILATATLHSFDVLRILSGIGYLQVFRPDQVQALARISVSAYSAGINLAFVFLGIGSTVFCYLWYESKYIPKALAGLGVVGSLLMAVGAYLIIIVPDLANTLSLVYMMPLAVFEVTIGFWLLIKGLPSSGAMDSSKAVN